MFGAWFGGGGGSVIPLSPPHPVAYSSVVLAMVMGSMSFLTRLSIAIFFP